MKLNHLNLTVTNVPETHTFLEKYFGLKNMGGNHNIAFLSDDNGLVLSLTSMKVGRETAVTYPATFHIGFIQASEERVSEINQRLKDDGFEVPPPSRQHGSWTFYFAAPAGSPSRSSPDPPTTVDLLLSDGFDDRVPGTKS